MNNQEAIDLLISKVKNNDTHCDYERTVEVSDTCRMYVTNKGLNAKLRQFKIREDEAAFQQRCRITKHIIKSVVSSLRKPFYKVSRNDRVKKKIDIKDEGKAQELKNMQNQFFANGGLDAFMRTRFVELTFIDPNSWVVIEWPSFKEGSLPRPYPYEIKSHEARDFEYEAGVLQWLFAAKEIAYRMKNDKKHTRLKKKNGFKYMIYSKDITAVMTQVDRPYIDENPNEIPEGAAIIELDKKHYILQSFEHKAGVTPAMRIGYKRDDLTDGRTFVAPYDEAEPFLEKMVNSNSEFDLTIAAHVFPQKFQYAYACPGPSVEQSCNKGRLADGCTCPTCEGTGTKFHKSSQDAITLPLPGSGFGELTNDMLVDLSKLMHYEGPPIDTVTFQKDYIDYLEMKTHQAMYNSTVFVKINNPKIAETATEKDQDMDSVYDTLLPFAEQFSLFWLFSTSVMVVLVGLKNEEVEKAHVFPKDFKLRTMSQLLNQLKTLNDSQAPTFVKEAVNRDLAEVICSGDQMEMIRYDTKQRFYPFAGKSEAEIMFLMSGGFVTNFNKVLYANFELIFREIEKDIPNFYMLNSKRQWEIVGKKVNVIIEDINKGSADKFTVRDLAGTEVQSGEQEGKQQSEQGNAA